MLSRFFQNQIFAKACTALVILYLAFAGFMIWRSSSVAIDGHRYFSLFDDAMISMRYADNLAHGHGLVWNAMVPSERVEGFTNPLLVFIMAGAILMFGKIGGVLAIQLLGLLLLAADIWLILKISTKLLPKNQFHDTGLFLITFLSLTFYPLLYWSIMGMETGLLTTLVLWAMYLIVTETEEIFINWNLGIILGLCYLTRPDSVILIAIVFLFRLIKKVRSVSTLARLAGEAVVVLVIIALYQLFRSGYYGTILPNTYTLKATGMALGTRIENGILFIVPLLRQFSALIIIAIISLTVVISHGGKTLRKKLDELFAHSRSHALLFLALFAAYLNYQIAIGGDPWPPYWRFTVPYTILFFIALIVISSVAASLIGVSKKQFVWLFAVLIVLELLYGGKAYVYDLIIDRRPFQSSANDYNINTAVALRELTSEKATVATFWGGTIPYYSERYAIDPLGKMDSYIANLPADVSGAVGWGGMISVPGHNKYDLTYSFKRLQPDFIQYIGGAKCTWGRQNLKRWCDTHYSFVTYKGIQILLKNGSPNVYWDKLR